LLAMTCALCAFTFGLYVRSW